MLIRNDRAAVVAHSGINFSDFVLRGFPAVSLFTLLSCLFLIFIGPKKSERSISGNKVFALHIGSILDSHPAAPGLILSAPKNFHLDVADIY